MKTTLLFALVFGVIISSYSQINRNRKTEATAEQFSVNGNKKSAPFDKYKFVDKFPGSFKDAGWSYDFLSPLQPLGKSNEEIYFGWTMPCFIPEGMFSMRVYKPDSSMKYTMLLK
jgi:hypothetical protein